MLRCLGFALLVLGLVCFLMFIRGFGFVGLGDVLTCFYFGFCFNLCFCFVFVSFVVGLFGYLVWWVWLLRLFCLFCGHYVFVCEVFRWFYFLFRAVTLFGGWRFRVGWGLIWVFVGLGVVLLVGFGSLLCCFVV